MNANIHDADKRECKFIEAAFETMAQPSAQNTGEMLPVLHKHAEQALTDAIDALQQMSGNEKTQAHIDLYRVKNMLYDINDMHMRDSSKQLIFHLLDLGMATLTLLSTQTLHEYYKEKEAVESN